MDLTTNSLLLLFIIQAVLSMVTPGSTSDLWDGLEYFQESIKSNLPFHRLVFLTLMRPLENKVDLVIHLLLSWEMYSNGIKLLMSLFIVCKLLKEHVILFWELEMEKANSEVSNIVIQSAMWSEIQIYSLKLTGIHQLKTLSTLEWTGDVLLSMSAFTRC